MQSFRPMSHEDTCSIQRPIPTCSLDHRCRDRKLWRLKNTSITQEDHLEVDDTYLDPWEYHRSCRMYCAECHGSDFDQFSLWEDQGWGRSIIKAYLYHRLWSGDGIWYTVIRFLVLKLDEGRCGLKDGVHWTVNDLQWNFSFLFATSSITCWTAFRDTGWPLPWLMLSNF